MTLPAHIVIVGAGLAAQRACQALRKRGHDGRITLVGDEGVLPYDRPPLSKEHLAGVVDDKTLTLRPASWYDEHAVELVLDDAAVALDPLSRAVQLAGGASLAYDRLLVATGARAASLPETEGLENVHVLRSAAHARALSASLHPGTRLAIVGAGFIGQEVAATARALAAKVTLIEASPAPLHNLLGPQLGEWFAGVHRSEGVRLETGARIERLHAGGGVLHAVELADGTRIECDAALVGIGVRPAAGWLGRTSLPADARGATEIEHVFAAGDVTGSGHWETAVSQGIAAAHGMLGLEPPESPRPSFWSDQYGVRIQCVGDARGADSVEIDGDPDARDFTALFLRDGVVRAGLLAGRPRALPALRDQIDQPLTARRTA